MDIVELIIIPVLFILNVFLALAYESEGRTHNKYYSSIINSGLVKFVYYGNKLLQSDEATKSLVMRRLSNIYYELDALRTGIHGDKSNIKLETNAIYSASSYSKELVHIPKESKIIPLSHRLKIKYTNFEFGEDIQFHFPRIKYLKKVLPSITIEPYQRVMSFSIEVCMIPSIWYLELIHCMYMGMAKYFTGIVMSFSMQDIVGSAIMSIGYKDESFSIENCYYSVSLIADDAISKNYIPICKSMEACLKSKPLSESAFSAFRSEFEERIKRAYSLLKWKNGDLNPIQFAKYSLLYSLYFVKDRIKIRLFYPEKNFLPIRIMLSSLGIYCISGLNYDPPKSFQIVETLAELISKGIMLSLDSFYIDCSFKVLELLKRESNSAFPLAEFFCKEIFSFGFIDENIDVINQSDDFKVITKPSRVLIPSYPSVIPKMQHNLEIDKYDTDWMNFTGTIEVELNKEIEGSKKKRVFTSRALKHTKKMDPSGVRNRFELCGSNGKKPIKLSKKITLIFNKSKRKSYSITGRISQ
ncbi:uncharacterized protein ELE39_000106 [Cryptosporidium sp. chipmunk genotype I]|uniref:uncharacterized protein n=1 Tax=Cryptosporidium sp. chipmunk genotype I TaxID=1280935 RepID=UPI00351A25E7|nr:hypothetical protein ELE39_000106 [Cryptosporidium sp. chipmunk genotype I]